CALIYKVIGSRSIIASYSGDPNFLASNAPLTQTVHPAASTSTVLTSSPNPSPAGQQVTYSATVSPAPDGGTVVFKDSGATIPGCGTQAVSSSTGIATC